MGFIFFNTLKGHRYPLLVTALLLVGFGVVIAASYESIEGSGFLGQQMPKGISAFLKAEGALLLASGPQGYLAVAFRHPIFLVVLSSFAIATASGALAREIEHRTILILLARPLPRYRLVLGRGLEAATLLVVLVFALLVGTLIGASAAGIMDGVRLGPLLLASLNGLILAAAIMGYSFLLSALSSDGARAILFATALTVASFVLDFISGLFDVLEPLGLTSLFHYYDPVGLAVNGSFPGLHVGILLAVAALGFGAAVWVFQRRDIAA